MRVLRISHSAVVDAWRERERILAGRGHRVRQLSARVWNEGGADVALRARPGEDVVGVRTWGRHPALFVYDPRPIWRALGEDWDLVDIHEEPFALATAEILALRALRSLGGGATRRRPPPYVLYSAQNIDKGYPVPFRWLESLALSRAAGASVCNAEAGAILSRKGLRMPARVIPLGTNLKAFAPYAVPAVREEPRGPVRVAFVGRLETHKGLDVLLDAVATEPRLALRIAGAGPLEAATRARITRSRLGDRVTLLGPVPQSELPDLYRWADVVAVPSLTTAGWVEQFGRVAVEAMACGTPVVASRSGALPDVVGEAGVLVPPGDAPALRSALLRVGGDAELAGRLREAGLRRAAATGWESVADDYEQLYRRAAGLGQRLRPGRVSARSLEIVVVAYGAAELLRRALAPLRGEVVHVVDNSSDDAVRAVCAEEKVAYVDSGRNGGFAAGVNEGLRRLRSADSDVLLLNPDAIIQPAGIRRLHEALLAEPDLASVGPRVVDQAGAEARVAWPFPSPSRAWLDAVGLGRHGACGPGGFVIGAALLLRGEALADVGGFDEHFFLYAEETDWALRASRRGWRHAVVRDVTAVHVGGGTSSDPARREAHFHAGQERYYRKHFGAAGWAAARLAVLTGSVARSALRGDRGAAARSRVVTYLRGPMSLERAQLPEGRDPGLGAATEVAS